MCDCGVAEGVNQDLLGVETGCGYDTLKGFLYLNSVSAFR